MVVRRDAADAGTLAGCIGPINEVCLDVAVPIKVASITDAADAILNRILLSVVLNFVKRPPKVGSQRCIAAIERKVPRRLPAADDCVHQAAAVAAQQLALAKRQVHQKVRVHGVLGYGWIARVPEQLDAVVKVGWDRARQKLIGPLYAAIAVAKPGIATRPHHIAHHVEHLEGVTFGIAVLHFNLDGRCVRPAGFVILLDFTVCPCRVVSAR